MADNQWWPKREEWPEFPPDTEFPILEGWRPGVEQALALLILDDAVCLLNGGKSGIAPMVNCGDTFAYACADAEPIPPVDFGADLDRPFWDLYDAYRKDGHWGATRWCCLRRRLRPLREVERSMREAGMWTLELDALPERLG